jgi:uncharacterized protein YkwD
MKLLNLGLLATLATATLTNISVLHKIDSVDANTIAPNPSVKRTSNQSKSSPLGVKINNQKQYFRSSRSKLVAMNDIELAIYQQVNQYRKSRNLPPLVIDPNISAQAKAHSQAMAKTGHLTHNGFQGRVAVLSNQISYRNAAENVAYNQGYNRPDLVAVKGWIESPGHHRNMIGQYDLTGIGVTKNESGAYYFTQIFILKQ